MDSEIDLELCPFCGDEVVKHDDEFVYHLSGGDCMLSGKFYKIKAWNTRHGGKK